MANGEGGGQNEGQVNASGQVAAYFLQCDGSVEISPSLLGYFKKGPRVHVVAVAAWNF